MWIGNGELTKNQEIGQEKPDALRGPDLNDIKINNQGHGKEANRNF